MLRKAGSFRALALSCTVSTGRGEAGAVWQVLTDEEKDKWIEYGELSIRGRQ